MVEVAGSSVFNSHNYFVVVIIVIVVVTRGNSCSCIGCFFEVVFSTEQQ